MDFDFAIILLSGAVGSGLIWLIDAAFFARGRAAANALVKEGEREVKEPWLTEQAKSFFPVLAIILIVRSFWFEPFKIPSPSLVPTLLTGDFIVVNKYIYGIRLPVWNKKVLSISEPKRGEIVVFRRPPRQFPGYDNPKDNPVGRTFIKRLVGVPGDHIVYKDHQLYVNDVAMETKVVSPYTFDSTSNDRTQPAPPCYPQLMSEDLTGVQHQMLHCAEGSLEGDWVVPAGQYFMMGDNRDNSSDSRDWGFVPEANLVGRASFIWFHFDYERKGYVAWNRIGKVIK
jgi:signal peptidase I